MDIKKVLEKGHSKPLTDKIVTYIGASQERFNTLMAIFLDGPYRITQRAAWPLSYCVMNHPFLIERHYPSVLKILVKPGIHDAVKRNIVRLLQFVTVPRQYQGKVIEACFELMDPKEPIAVRAFSMTVLGNLASEHPDLKKELKLVIEDQLPFGSAGYVARAKKVLKQLEK
ncbi:MAG TPA: hypothetical protein PK325_09670 [Cyclobacteriaceae bacterium]|nr:hypothetical protein [Cyclobacteriaceae bacterium]HMV09494.1 hypothetical protein [Cyclobacteriaceae bacterium]HMV90098.1 hypothetical protein [Cyclobacteriaceae bacterium]HMX02673.1 hypothetical protein [Cyclobacteriaceae bacterium]HMX51604.1 hypothetical protein [Cyclobacteriaceae bacterium]